MARLVDDGKELQFVGFKDLAEHYAAVRNRLNGRQRVVEALKPRADIIVAHFIEPLRFAFTNGTIIDPDLKPPISIMQIISACCRYFHMSYNDIISARRAQRVVIPRHIAIYLSHELTPNSYPAIGRKFFRDHTSCLHAVRHIDELIKQGGIVAHHVEHLRAALDE